jgi:hypothetical protein
MTQAADEFRPDVPSTARIYDYYLGGKDNYPADRAAAEHIIASMPNGVVRTAAVQNRKFLMRAVRHLTADLGVRQFLDIGTGLPTMNSVHQVAQSIAGQPRRLRRPRPDRAGALPQPAARQRACHGHPAGPA